MKILSEYETMDRLKKGMSISRYGDGEFTFMLENKGINLMQDFNDKLKKKLIFVLTNPLNNLLIGIPRYGKGDHFNRGIHLLSDIIYGSSFISRPKTTKLSNVAYFDNMKSIWRDKDIVIVNFNENIVNHYLYKDNNIDYIKINKRNCFDEYEIILNKCREYYNQNKIFILSAGPTATCLSYDITLEGEQCIDIGHITYEYSQFIKEENPRSWVSQN